MTKTSLAGLALMILVTIPAYARVSVLPPTPDKDPFIGTWRANQDKSAPKLSERGATYTRVITRDGADLVLSSREGTTKPRKSEYRIRCDGALRRTPVGSLSCLYKAPNFIEGETKLANRDAEYWTREVSADGEKMTVLAYTDPARTKLVSTWILDRVK